jgi:hypothetical protein
MSWKRINRRQVQVFNGRGSEQREDDDKEDMCANIDYIYIYIYSLGGVVVG